MNRKSSGKILAALIPLLVHGFGNLPAGFAQEHSPEPAPLITAPADWMHWRMKILPKEGEKAKAEQDSSNAGRTASTPIEMDFVRTGELMRVIVLFGSGDRREFWRLGGHTLVRNISNRVRAQPDNPRDQVYPFESRGFYGIEHVRPTDEVGEVPFQTDERPTRYFRGSRTDSELVAEWVPTENEEPELRIKIPYEAWFDLETGLPRAYSEGRNTFHFEFFSPPQEQLTLPQEWQQAWDRHRLNLRRAGLAN